MARASSPCLQHTFQFMLLESVFPFLIKDRVTWLGGGMGFQPMPQTTRRDVAVTRVIVTAKNVYLAGLVFCFVTSLLNFL